MWKDIPNWENYYEINELGEVRNKITKKLIIPKSPAIIPLYKYHWLTVIWSFNRTPAPIFFKVICLLAKNFLTTEEFLIFSIFFFASFSDKTKLPFSSYVNSLNRSSFVYFFLSLYWILPFRIILICCVFFKFIFHLLFPSYWNSVFIFLIK